jgi:hypothetical protein
MRKTERKTVARAMEMAGMVMKYLSRPSPSPSPPRSAVHLKQFRFHGG